MYPYNPYFNPEALRKEFKSHYRRIIIEYAKVILVLALFLLLLDFFGFALWATSGQMPADGLYLGKLTTEMIKLLL